jgi:hypothetical protein
MRDKIRQWFVDTPQAMDFAYVMILGSSVFLELSTQEATGATSGP